MRSLFLFVIVVISSTQFSYFPAQYSEPGLNYTEQKVELENGYAHIIRIDGADTLIIGEDGRLVESADGIYQILKRSILSSSGYMDAVGETKEILARIETKRETVEKECYKHTGMDKFECTSRESCILAAFSTPIASMAVNADGFWEAMLEYRKENEKAREEIRKVNEIIAPHGPGAESVAQVQVSLGEISGAIERIDSNPLFLTIRDEGCGFGGWRSCFEYCPKIGWEEDESGFNANLNAWKDASRKLENADVQELAIGIYKNTVEWKEYLERRKLILGTAKDNVNKIDAKISGALASVDYKIINGTRYEKEYAIWAIKFSEAKKLAEDGQFRNAILEMNGLENEGNDIYARIGAPVQGLGRIRERTKNIEKTLGEMRGDGENGAEVEELREEYSQFKSSLVYPIDPDGLEAHYNRAKEIEAKALLAYARERLEINADENKPGAPVTATPDGGGSERAGFERVLAQILLAIRDFFGWNAG